MASVEIDERYIDRAAGLRAVVGMDGRVFTVTLFHGENDFCGMRTEDGAAAMTAFNHPFSVIPGAVDTLNGLGLWCPRGAITPAGAPAGGGGGYVPPRANGEDDGA